MTLRVNSNTEIYTQIDKIVGNVEKCKKMVYNNTKRKMPKLDNYVWFWTMKTEMCWDIYPKKDA